MNMKKLAITTALIVGIGFAGMQQASARGWGGPGGGYGGDCGCYGIEQNRTLDEATRSKLNAFREDTTELRKQMAMKRAEKRALMASENPNPTEVAKVEGDLFDLRDQMRSKAIEAGVPAMGGGSRAMRKGGHRGWGGHGRGACLQQSSWN